MDKENSFPGSESKIISTLSHELRTPLATILSSVELLEIYINRLSELEKNQIFYKIKDSVNRMTLLLDDLVIINRIDTKKLVFSPSPFDFIKLCKEIINDFFINRKRLIKFYNELNFNKAFLDEVLLRHIIFNILLNAVNYSPDDSEISLNLMNNNKEILLQFTDSGYGIMNSDLHRIFDSYYRGKNVLHIPGTGIGLTVVKKCVDLYNGKIEIISQENKGTTVNVTLPLILEGSFHEKDSYN